MEKKISLSEALCGAAVHLQHLDGRILRIATPQGTLKLEIQG
jgi:DnaJ-class molecular chaperone